MSKEINNEKELIDKLERMVERVLPNALRNNVNNIRYATVTKVNTTTSTINARIGNLSDEFTNIKYQSGADNVQIGDSCLLISADPIFKGQVKAIVYSTPINANVDWWEEIGRTRLTTASDTLTIDNIPPRKYIKIISTLIPSGQLSPAMRFNNDTGNNYALRVMDNGAASTTSTSRANLGGIVSPGTLLIFSIIDVLNIADQEKIVHISTVDNNGDGAANAPNKADRVGKWSNTSDNITRVDWVNSGTGDFAAGSEIIILGHDNVSDT